jgi:ferrochelatase
MSDAVVLMAYGSPERLAEVPAYYADIRGGRPVAPEHLADLVERYRRLGVEESNPLNEITERTRAALERELGLPVYTGMKHWAPRIADAAGRAADADRVVGLVLAPHYSALSIKGYRDQLEQALDGRAELRFVESWHDEASFVDLLADKVRGTDAHVVFTAHSLPARIVEMGDPYRDQLLETARLVAERAALGHDWSFSFQSESPTGEPWLGPDILDHLRHLHGQGVARVLVCPVGFVSDHLEIRWDIDVEAQELARDLGLELSRIEMPNDEPRFIETLASIVRRTLAA